MELITDLGMAGSKPVATPMECNQRFTTVEYDQHLELKHDEKLPDAGPYQRLVGKLVYLTMTRPDICYAVHVLSQFMQCPKKSHMEAAIRVVRYIKGAPSFGLLMISKQCPKLTAFCDADWASCPVSRKFVRGYVMKLGDSLVS
ncbi:putative mitochondrial protein AtMg00240 [Nicotiana tabacum]|uniref:Mitochondrial protein AtMg00240 n=1 Tax=Nicotiana tabacum TaxID=4097 RepID=A0AC58USZ5_TOBAC